MPEYAGRPPRRRRRFKLCYPGAICDCDNLTDNPHLEDR